MANNAQRWVRDLGGAQEPLVMLGAFAAGATTAVKRGEIIVLANGVWAPLAADAAMAGTIAVANQEIKSGDRAGYYEIIVPRPLDVFEYEQAAAGATAVGTALYYSSSEKVTVTEGDFILGVAVGQEHYPLRQGSMADGDPTDYGTTLGSTAHVRMTFLSAVSYYAALQPGAQVIEEVVPDP